MSKNIFEKLKEKGKSVSGKESKTEENISENNELIEDSEEHEELLSTTSREELIEQVNQAEQKARENLDRVLRLQAEKDNMVRRTERDVENAHKYALEKFASELLPIIDSLELSANSIPEEMKESSKSVIEGVELTLKMFYAVMGKFGIEQIDPAGETFNPEFHQAIKTEESDSVESGKVISVMQKGYSLNNRLLRPALVIVSKAAE